MLDGNSFLQAGWIHGLKLHVFGSPESLLFAGRKGDSQLSNALKMPLCNACPEINTKKM